MAKEKKWYQYVGVRAAFILAIGGIIVAGMNIWHSRSELAQDNIKYQDEVRKKDERISALEQQNSKKTAEIQRLEIQLTPFKTIALEKYTGSEQEALQQLAQDIQEVQNKADELERQIQKRSITKDQKKLLISRLKTAKSKRITLTSVWGDQEAFQFAHTLKNIFIEAGWEVHGVNQAAYNKPMIGLWISIIEEPAPEEVNIIYQAFKAISYKVNGRKNNKQQKQLDFIIGSKQ